MLLSLESHCLGLHFLLYKTEISPMQYAMHGYPCKKMLDWSSIHMRRCECADGRDSACFYKMWWEDVDHFFLLLWKANHILNSILLLHGVDRMAKLRGLARELSSSARTAHTSHELCRASHHHHHHHHHLYRHHQHCCACCLSSEICECIWWCKRYLFH